MNAAPLVALSLLALSSAPGVAAEVAEGCDVPRASNLGHTFFVDPMRGAKENDGSETRPWRTLAEVLDPANHLVATRAYGRTKDGLAPPAPVNPNGPIRPGDTIVLMSGDHGSVQVRQYVNDDFITVMAAKGQTPVVRSLRLVASAHWLFRGIKFQGTRPTDDKRGPLVGLMSHGWVGPSSDIILVDNSFSTEDSTSGWSPEDWVNRPYAIGFLSSARCTTLIDNHFFNLRDAVGIAADQSLVQGNVIEDVGNDGIDTTASNVVIRGNRIGSSKHTPAEPLHADGIQGWTNHGATNRNVVIDSNRIVNLNSAEDNYLQGITIFDGKWDGLQVTNNVVITNSWHGISLYGVTNAQVVNNTVIPTRPDHFPTWLIIHNSKDRTPSKNILVRNNIATQILVGGENLVVDHNIASKKIDIELGDRTLITTRGSAGDHNFVDPGIFSQFSDYDARLGHLDLRPGPRSAAARAGDANGAPTFDIDGRRRVAPADIGAYAR